MATPARVHFIGIGGIGMSGLARLYAHEGAQVSGSDVQLTDLTAALEGEGMKITDTQTAKNITSDIDLVVYTDALPVDHEELAAARAAEIKTQNYFEALAEIANQYVLIAVAGTHGKTTTTAMIVDIMEEASLDPTAIVGSLRSKTGSNFRAGKSKFFVVEACEYKKHFLHLAPDILVVTNVEHEHTDYFKDLGEVQAAFCELVMRMNPTSHLLCDSDDPTTQALRAAHRGNYSNYASYLKDPDVLALDLKQPGIHNVKNAAAALAAVSSLQVGGWYGQVDRAIAFKALENFAGTWRRYEYKGKVNGAPVFDDYAHHPTEITATLQATREKYPTAKITAVFQPHTYSRTKELFDDFVTALRLADRVIMVPIYAAREIDEGTVSSEMIVEKVPQADHVHTLEAAAGAIKDSVTPDDVVIVMGAGDVTTVASLLTR